MPYFILNCAKSAQQTATTEPSDGKHRNVEYGIGVLCVSIELNRPSLMSHG